MSGVRAMPYCVLTPHLPCGLRAGRMNVITRVDIV
jgi:hypothetical protein